MILNFNKFYLLIFLIPVIGSVKAQVPTDIPLELRAQFNGQYDYKIIGNTLTVDDNSSTTSANCGFLTQSTANLAIGTTQDIIAAYLYWHGIGDGSLDIDIQLNGDFLLADDVNTVDPVQNNFFFFFSSFKEVTPLI